MSARAAPGPSADSAFGRLYAARCWSVMSWDQLTAFWQRIDPAAGWYVYMLGETLPGVPLSAEAAGDFMRRIDALLRADHHESYCGIVYADNLEAPTLIKVFDPNNLGSSCGSSKHPPGPGWVMSLLPPEPLPPPRMLPEGRRRWWRETLAGSAVATG